MLLCHEAKDANFTVRILSCRGSWTLFENLWSILLKIILSLFSRKKPEYFCYPTVKKSKEHAKKWIQREERSAKLRQKKRFFWEEEKCTFDVSARRGEILTRLNPTTWLYEHIQPCLQIEARQYLPLQIPSYILLRAVYQTDHDTNVLPWPCRDQHLL